MKEQKTTKSCYIATLDLLGMRNAICKDIDNVHLNHIWNIYRSWLKIKENDFEFGHLKTKIFSDNIAIVIEESSYNALSHLLEYVAYMSEHFLTCGYKIRGAITKGQVYIDDTLIWGEGLVKAYILESKEAKYPRVIIDNEIVSDIPDRMMNEVIQYKNDFYYVDYLRWYGKNHSGYLETIEKGMKLLESEKDIEDPKVLEKNEWLLAYLLESKDFHSKTK